MKRYLLWGLVFVAIVSCAQREDKSVVGKWKLITRGVNAAGQPCTFIPDQMELFPDGTISMSIMPPQARMFYKTAVTSAEMKSLKKKSPALKGNERILFMKVTAKGDWADSAVAYNYTADGTRLNLELPGWSPSVYGRVK